MRLAPTRLASLGALGATGGLVLVYLLFVWLGWPQPTTAGIDWAHGSVLMISLGVLILALVAFHLVMAHQLWYAPAPVRRDDAQPRDRR